MVPVVELVLGVERREGSVSCDCGLSVLLVREFGGFGIVRGWGYGQVGEDEEMGGLEGGSIGDRCDAVESFILHEIRVRVMGICFDST